MVRLVVKKSQESLFLIDTTTDCPVKRIAHDIALINNLQLKCIRLADAADSLALHGIAKPLDLHGYTEEQLDAMATTPDIAPAESSGKVKNVVELPDGRLALDSPDPLGKRSGQAPMDDMADIIRKTTSEARVAVGKDLVASNRPLTLEACQEAIDRIRGAVTIVYPMGLPDFDPVYEILHDLEDISATQHAKDVFDPEAMSVWWAGKELANEKCLLDYVGRNEKTKIVVKIQKKGQGAPVREPPLDSAGQRDLMAYYYRKQEEQKRLDEAADDVEYHTSTWADPKSLKTSFLGMSNVSWRP